MADTTHPDRNGGTPVRPRSLLAGETVLPYRLREPLEAVVPWDSSRLLHGGDDRIDLYPGLASWWREAEALWNEHRSSERLDLLDRVDYRRGRSQQFPIPEHRVVYSASGMYLAAARVNDHRAVVEHKLYWASASSLDEARYLVAVLNTTELTRRVRPLQGRGEHNPRDFDKYVWRIPVPLYDPADERHRELARLAAVAEDLVTALDLPTGVSFEALRRRVRDAVATSEVGRRIETVVVELLG